MTIGKTTKRMRGRAPAATARYLALIRQFPLRPLTSDAELDRAIGVMNALLDRDHLHAAETDYLDVLSDLVERYEEVHHAIDASDLTDGEMLEHLMDAKGVSQTAVAHATGIAKSTISAVVVGDQTLNRSHIQRLSDYFNVNPGVFFGTAGSTVKRSRRVAMAPARRGRLPSNGVSDS